MGSSSVHKWPFLARADELAAIQASLDGPAHGGTVLVGAAGTGKTRLVDEVVAGAEQRGYRCLRVTASAAASEVPLGALAGLLPARARLSSPPGAGALHALAEQLTDDRSVLLVDDADLLDSASAMAVHQLVANRVSNVVVTVRAEPAGRRGVADIWRTGRLRRLDLAPLPPAAVAELTAITLGGPVAGPTLAFIQRVTAGNPLYLRELLDNELQLGSLGEVDGLWRMSDAPPRAGRLADLLGEDADTGDPHETRILELLALAGRLALPTLHDLGGAPPVESLERRGLLTIDADGRRLYARLAHPMFGEILRRTLPGTARVRHSRALADALESHGVRRRDDLLGWAVARLDGGGPIDAELMCAAARRATLTRADPVLRVRLARHAWEAGETTGAGLLLCGALLDAGQPAEALALLDRLEDRGGTPREAADIVSVRAAHLGLAEGQVDEALGLLADPDQAALRGLLLAAAGRPEQALDTVDEFLAARSLRTRIRACTAASLAYLLLARFPEAMRMARATHALSSGPGIAQTDGGDEAILVALHVRIAAEAGHVAQGRRLGRAALSAAARRGDTPRLAWLSAALASLELPAGNLDAAHGHAVEAASYFRAARTPVGLAWALAAELQVTVQRGDLVRGERIARELEAIRPRSEQVRAWHFEVDRALAWYEAQLGEHASACRRLGECGEYWLERGALLPVTLISADLARLGGADRGCALLAGTEPSDGWPLGEAIAGFVRAAAWRDGRGLERASDRFAELGLIGYAADARAAAVRAWSSAGSAGDERRAAGATAALAARCGNPRTPLLAAVPAGQLTRREHQIGNLAAQGLSNKEIAAKLIVSGRTVENHLAHVYSKLGVRGRVELADHLLPGAAG